MSKVYVEVLADGLTVGGQVRRAGTAVAVDNLEVQSKKDQVARWGEPRYKEISEAEFKERGGVEGDVPFAEEQAQQEAVSDPETSGAAGGPAEDPAKAEFSDLEGKNVDDTLSAVAGFEDDQTQRFIAWEKENANRKGVLEPLGAWTE